MNDMNTPAVERVEEAPAKQPKKNAVGYMIAMVAIVVLVLGTMLFFHLSAENEAKKTEQLQQQIASSIKNTGEMDKELMEQLRESSVKQADLVNMRNSVGVFGGGAAVVLIILLQLLSNKNAAVTNQSSENGEPIEIDENNANE